MIVAEQVAILLIFVCIGCFMKKKQMVPEGSATALSRILVYLCLPAMTFNTFANQLSVENLKTNYIVLVYSFIIVAVLVVLGKLLARLFTKDRYDRGVYSYTFTVSNYGYAGYALMSALYGESGLMQMMIFTIAVSLYTYTEGYRLLIDRRRISFVSLINPAIISIIVGAAVGLSGLKLPTLLTDLISRAAGCMSPLSMLMTGFVIAEFDILKMLKNAKAYIVTALRLLGIPMVLCFVLKLFHAPEVVILCSIMTFAMPCGLNPVIFAKFVNHDCELGASFALISSIFSILTVPLMIGIFC